MPARRSAAGCPELRRTLAEAGVSEPLWFEVPKSKRAPGAVKQALEEGADLILAWGGDGMVRRCVNALGDTQVPLAILPAGTSNLFATNLGIEPDIAQAVQVALHGERRRLDVGRFNGERFAVMAGAGLDAAMIKGADDLKDRLGRAAYVLGGAANLNAASFEAKIKVDGTRWYKGAASCILVGNVGDLFGGIEVFADAQPDDGLLDVGVLTSDGPVQLARAVTRTAVGSAREVAVRTRHPGALGEREARPQGPLRARRRRPQEGQVVQGRCRSRRDHGLRPARGPRRERSEMSTTWRTWPRTSATRREREGDQLAGAKPLGWLARAGFVARGLVYLIIGVLALKLALGDGGKATNQQGAMKTIAHQPFGEALLILVAIGLAGYALWRLIPRRRRPRRRAAGQRHQTASSRSRAASRTRSSA